MSLDDVGGNTIYSAAKKGRSLIEDETKAVENRIRMIKFEEARALKRIQETRERISEVYKARTRYLEDKHSKNVGHEKETKELNDLKEAVRSNRVFQQEKLEYTKNEILSAKQSIGKRVRGWKEYIRRKTQQQTIDEKRQKRKVKEAIQMSNKQGALRMKLLKDIKQQKGKVLYARRVEMENLKRVEVEQQLTELGKEEEELMQRVASIHEKQKMAVEELEKVYL
jgi:hypothetical protein